MPSVYEIVTEQVIAQLESGVAPWRKPWPSNLPCNLVSQKPYRGMNVLFLATQAHESRYWLTFNQCAKLGGRVKAGSKSTFVTFWNIGAEKLNSTTGRETKPFLLRYYRVFNLGQTEGEIWLRLQGSSNQVHLDRSNLRRKISAIYVQNPSRKSCR